MCRLVLMTIALLAILFGISGLYMLPKVIQQKIEQRIQLKIGTKTFDRFTRIPIPLTVKFHFFDVTNSEQVLAGLERPKFQEVGPFVYKQWRRREIVDLLDNNRKVTYKEIKTFYPLFPKELENSTNIKYVMFDMETNKVVKIGGKNEEMMEEDEEQLFKNNYNYNNNENNKTTIIKMLNPYAHNLTLVNLPLLSVLTQLAQIEEGTLKRSLASKIASRLIENGREKILITRRASDFLFDGYKVGLMDAANDLISNTFGYNFESPLPRNKFGFFHTKNATWSRREAGEMTIFTGRNNSMDNFMLVDNWNGLKTLDVWHKTPESGNRCNEVRGTDGSQFHPGVTRQHVLNIFSPMICTSIFIKYKEDTTARGIPLLRFSTPPEVFGAPKKNPSNACYCTIKNQEPQLTAGSNGLLTSSSRNNMPTQPTNGQIRVQTVGHTSRAKITNARCYLDGLMDLSLCQRGAPIAASAPHFYNSDPMLALAAGLSPDKTKHETYLDIEPMTGAVMRAASRAQLSAFVEEAALNVVDERLIGHMTPMVAPLLWLEEAAEIDEKSANEFKGQLLNLVQKANKSFNYSIVIGVIIILVVSVQCWYVTFYKLGPVSKRPAETKGDDEEEKRGARHRRRSAEGGARKLSGARKANLAGASPLVTLLSEEDGKGRREGSSAGGSRSRGGKGGASAAVVGVAAALGAADSAAPRHARALDRRRQPPPTRRPGYRQHENDADDDDEALSRRALVSNEWPAPGKCGQTTSGATSSSHSFSGGNDANGEPSTRAGSSEEPVGPHSDTE